MLTDKEYPIGKDLTVYPFKDTEASGSYDLFRLKAFVSALESLLDAQNESKTLADWKLFLLNEVIAKMVYCDDFKKDDRAELNSIYRVLSFADQLEFGQKIPFSVFLDELKTKLFTESRESKLNTGRVTVSSPIPVRGLPYKVICFLGLNNDIFPRKDRFMGFDLLGEGYLKGDRNIKETDKYLFLDTILAAREKLYLSYIGQSVKDNTEIPPSIAVDTLLDYTGNENFVVKHPLHGFSSRYQNDSPRLFTYLHNKNTDEYSIKKIEKKPVSEVSINSLVKFFQAPVDWYFNTILDIRFEDNDSRLSETELFDLDNLQMWKIKNELLRLEENDFESYLNKGKKEGYLPLKSAAEGIIEKLNDEIEFIKPVFKKLVNNRPEEKVVIDTVIDNIRITGTIESVYDNDFIAYCLSSHPLKYKIEAYIKSLLLSEAGKINSAKFLDRTGVVSNVPLPNNSSICELENLLKYFREGNNAPLLFSIKASEAFASTPTKNQTKLDQMINAFNKEAYPVEKNPYPANLYLQILIREKYFENFGDEDIQKIGDLAEKLNLNFI
jgi:exodeoxyribonuclease V gamma subunit